METRPRFWRIFLSISFIAAISVSFAANGTFLAGSAGAARTDCYNINAPSDIRPSKASSLATVEQAYRCLLAHYVTAKSTLDDRILLRGADAFITSQLQRPGLADTAIPALTLTGQRNQDWSAFAQWYNSVLSSFPIGTLVSNAFAEASIIGMTNALKDDHTGYLPAQYMKAEISQLNDGPVPTLGFVISPIANTIKAPIYITDVFSGTPAAGAGLVPGDVITAVNGTPPTNNGQPTQGLISLQIPASGSKVTLTVTRPSTGISETVTLTTRTLQTPVTTEKLLASNIGYVKLFSFTSDAASRVFKSIQALQRSAKLTGLVLDLRNNQGGDVDQAVRIISAFVHKGIVSYNVDGSGHRTALNTVDSVPLLRVPVVVLIDSGSASSSEVVAATVKDLRLGRVVGHTSAGALAGAEFYGLNDGSGMEITEERVLGPNAEKIDGVGVQPNDVVLGTALDLSNGRDPVETQAVKELKAASVAR